MIQHSDLDKISRVNYDEDMNKILHGLLERIELLEGRIKELVK